jgi:mannose-6-phosphate isomerase-like protein (cupin superfamily)
MDVKNLNDVPAFITKDGSEIRELLAYRNSCIRNQSLAEARLPPGASTTAHRHLKTEEIYYILEGQGLMDWRGKPVRSAPAMRLPFPRAVAIRSPISARPVEVSLLLRPAL